MNRIIENLVQSIADDADTRQWHKSLFLDPKFYCARFTEDCEGKTHAVIEITEYYREGNAPKRYSIEWIAHEEPTEGATHFANRAVNFDVDEKTFNLLRVFLNSRTTNRHA